MTLYQFIRDNKHVIDRYLSYKGINAQTLLEYEEWILTDEGLRLYAEYEGVLI